jgi:hypothetical protein
LKKKKGGLGTRFGQNEAGQIQRRDFFFFFFPFGLVGVSELTLILLFEGGQTIPRPAKGVAQATPLFFFFFSKSIFLMFLIFLVFMIFLIV